MNTNQDTISKNISKWVGWLQERIPELKKPLNQSYLVFAFSEFLGQNSINNIIDIKSIPFDNNIFPKRATDNNGVEEEFSVDVITIDKGDLMNLGYYNYDTKKWAFHTDTLSDYYESGKLKDFVWIYKPDYLAINN